MLLNFVVEYRLSLLATINVIGGRLCILKLVFSVSSGLNAIIITSASKF